MTTFPGSPRLLKGAIIGLDPMNPLASVVVFQYDPDTLKRRLHGGSMGGANFTKLKRTWNEAEGRY